MACLFPPRCPVCGDLRIPWESSTCPECAGKLHRISGPTCFKCGREISGQEQEYCASCEEKPPSVDRNFAVWRYDRRMKKSIAAFKYGGRREYSSFYVRHMAQEIGRLLLRYQVTVLVPVPVSAKRRRFRGFNQAKLLADGLARELGITSAELLVRIKDTRPQNSLTPEERKQNLEGAIGWNEAAAEVFSECPGTVAVIDDIYTTGSTLSACADVLREHGVVRIYGVCVCIGAD